MLTKAHLSVHVLFALFVLFFGARADEIFLLWKQMLILTKAHLSVLGCRFVALQLYASEFDSWTCERSSLGYRDGLRRVQQSGQPLSE
jgi:hypothetical protein